MCQLQVFEGSKVGVEGSNKSAHGLNYQEKSGVVCGELERWRHRGRIRVPGGLRVVRGGRVHVGQCGEEVCEMYTADASSYSRPLL